MPKTINHDLCLQCSQYRQTCCNFTDHYIPLLIEDMQKILALGYKVQDFMVASEFEEDDLSEEEDWWKQSLVKIADKYYQISILSKGEAGCLFLKNGQGCTLGKQRPAICRLYPFWFDKNKQLKYQDDFCEAYKQKISFEDCMKIMGEKEEDIKEYYAKIRTDFIQKKPKYEQLTKLLLDKKYDDLEKIIKSEN